MSPGRVCNKLGLGLGPRDQQAVVVRKADASSSDLGLPKRISTSLSANCSEVPGPWLVTTQPLTTTFESTHPVWASLKFGAG